MNLIERYNTICNSSSGERTDNVGREDFMKGNEHPYDGCNDSEFSTFETKNCLVTIKKYWKYLNHEYGVVYRNLLLFKINNTTSIRIVLYEE